MNFKSFIFSLWWFLVFICIMGLMVADAAERDEGCVEEQGGIVKCYGHMMSRDEIKCRDVCYPNKYAYFTGFTRQCVCGGNK